MPVRPTTYLLLLFLSLAAAGAMGYYYFTNDPWLRNRVFTILDISEPVRESIAHKPPPSIEDHIRAIPLHGAVTSLDLSRMANLHPDVAQNALKGKTFTLSGRVTRYLITGINGSRVSIYLESEGERPVVMEIDLEKYLTASGTGARPRSTYQFAGLGDELHIVSNDGKAKIRFVAKDEHVSRKVRFDGMRAAAIAAIPMQLPNGLHAAP